MVYLSTGNYLVLGRYVQWALATPVRDLFSQRERERERERESDIGLEFQKSTAAVSVV